MPAAEGFLGSRLRPLAGSSESFERAERWQTHWDWKAFRGEFRAEREKIAGFAREQQVFASERVVEMYYHTESGSDDDGPDLIPA